MCVCVCVYERERERESLVGFYGIATFVGYLMPNPVNTQILNIYMIFKHILLITFLN